MKKCYLIISIIIIFIILSFPHSSNIQEECFPIWNFGEIVGFRFELNIPRGSLKEIEYYPKVYGCINHYKDYSTIKDLSIGFIVHNSNKPYRLTKLELGRKVYHYDKKVYSNSSMVLVYYLSNDFFAKNEVGFIAKIFLNTL